MAEPLSRAAQKGDNIFGNLSQAQYLEFRDRYSDADRAVADAVATRKDLRASIKAAGMPLKAFDRARRDSDVSGEVRENEELWYRRLMGWLQKPVGFQASMDIATNDPGLAALNVHELKRVDNEGFEAGKAGHKRDQANSYTPGTEAAQRFDTAWLRGQAEIAGSMATGRGNVPENGGEPRRRGRPAGSRNKPKADAAVEPQPEAVH